MALPPPLALSLAGADRQRKRLLRTVPVVGVTACSSRLSALDGQRFDLLVLDESSQMVEPLSVVPLLRCQARFLLAAGDPLQLPPVVAAPPHVTAASGAPSGQGLPHGLLRPLFVRLAALGVPPYLLRRQYRCHPDISAVPNSHFYGGRLLDGCSREARASLVPGLPSLALLDVRGQESYGAGEGTILAGSACSATCPARWPPRMPLLLTTRSGPSSRQCLLPAHTSSLTSSHALPCLPPQAAAPATRQRQRRWWRRWSASPSRASPPAGVA